MLCSHLTVGLNTQVGMLIVGRLINGFGEYTLNLLYSQPARNTDRRAVCTGAGQLTATFPVYASEIAPPEIRGALGGLQMVMIEAAIFCATGTGYGFGTYYTNSLQW